MMKLPAFRRDPAAALDKARADRQAAIAKLADLEQRRGVALVEADDLEQLVLLDAEDPAWFHMMLKASESGWLRAAER